FAAVGRAAMPGLVMPYHRGSGGTDRAEDALAFIRGVALGVLVVGIGTASAPMAAGDELRGTQFLIHIAQIVVEVKDKAGHGNTWVERNPLRPGKAHRLIRVPERYTV